MKDQETIQERGFGGGILAHYLGISRRSGPGQLEATIRVDQVGNGFLQLRPFGRSPTYYTPNASFVK